MVNIDTIKNNLEEQMEESYLRMIDTKSSAGMLYLHLLGTIIADDRIKINQINTYQNPFDFYEKVNKAHIESCNETDIELFCIAGLNEKINFITEVIDNELKNNFESFNKQDEIKLSDERLDFLANIFNRILNENVFLGTEIKVIKKKIIESGVWKMACYWIGEEYELENYSLTEDLLNTWSSLEKPIIMGKQLMIQSFQLAEINGKKIIGTFPNCLTEEWQLVLEGGLKINLNSEFPYIREHTGVRDIGILTIKDIDTISDNPIYAYGKSLEPKEIYEDWHKVFLYIAAIKNCQWNMDSIILYFEKFIDFIEKNICDTLLAPPQIDKITYYKILNIKINKIREFMTGKEEEVISKDLWQLLNNKYAYLPYIYEVLDISNVQTNCIFEIEKFKNQLELLDVKNFHQKGINLEEIASYFISNIPGLKVTGKRVKTGYEEIDLSAVNISLDNQLWEMGSYFLIECKNWDKKVDVKVIRSLSHICELKGNKTTILFSNKGVTKDAEREIKRIAITGKYILNITKNDLYKIESKEDCYNLLITKWNELQEIIEKELFL